MRGRFTMDFGLEVESDVFVHWNYFKHILRAAILSPYAEWRVVRWVEYRFCVRARVNETLPDTHHLQTGPMITTLRSKQNLIVCVSIIQFVVCLRQCWGKVSHSKFPRYTNGGCEFQHFPLCIYGIDQIGSGSDGSFIWKVAGSNLPKVTAILEPHPQGKFRGSRLCHDHLPFPIIPSCDSTLRRSGCVAR
jgi:hypothetical protein